MAIVSLNDLYGGKKSEELESVVIFMANVSGETPATITLPDGYKWSDFELININASYSSADFLVNSIEVNREWILNKGVNWRAMVRMSTHLEDIYTIIRGETESTASVTYTANGALGSIIGYKKKYATTNLSVVLDVNGGNDITVNSRYEIPASALPANFLESDGSIKKNVIVRAEINISGSLYSGWAEYSKVLLFGGTPTYQTYGVECQVVNNKLLVFTGNNSGVLALPSSQITNAWGNSSDITSAPCRVVATLAGEAYTVQTA